MAEPNEILQTLNSHIQRSPHSRALGLEVVSAGAERTELRLPFRPEFLGDVERQLIHPGIVTTLIDSACGISVRARVGLGTEIATLDLRIDFLRPGLPGIGLVCGAECYRVTSQIAFVRASVWQDNPSVPVAASVATFMLHSSTRPGSPPAS